MDHVDTSTAAVRFSGGAVGVHTASPASRAPHDASSPPAHIAVSTSDSGWREHASAATSIAT
jgi:hypothetical protein